jgi:hypothetical protein
MNKESLPKPKPIPEVVGRHLVVEMRKNPDSASNDVELCNNRQAFSPGSKRPDPGGGSHYHTESASSPSLR